ncbi:MAG: TIGR01777 family protein [Desulfobacterales bacterium]|nr:MAG: TIGR01777 family protein [Desulfobacterales bacterium]
MKVWISGGTGFVGSALCRALLAAGHEVTAAGSRPVFSLTHPRLTHVSADLSIPGLWQDGIRSADAVINLAGRSIFRYWTAAYKRSLARSRLKVTANMADALDPERPVPFISASAVGFYGPGRDDILDENAPAGGDFLSGLAVDWENAAQAAARHNARVIIARFGIVLGKNGGALKRMLPSFRLGLGGPLGSGRQWFPWIHMNDLIRALIFLLERDAAKGAYNLAAPAPVRQKEFARSLGRALGRPAVFPAPGFVIKTVMGEMGGMLLTGQRIFPRRLLADGFQFSFPELAPALADLLTSGGAS